ncbi:uncharacterized protein LOC143020298 [Oratosquilla oratoria]|uniref:uncharacterized protein LOC143020298 n=1 Tax=Oratosquilla oratoria TaxID=337810 RepID=UPI003F75DBAD
MGKTSKKKVTAGEDGQLSVKEFLELKKKSVKMEGATKKPKQEVANNNNNNNNNVVVVEEHEKDTANNNIINNNNNNSNDNGGSLPPAEDEAVSLLLSQPLVEQSATPTFSNMMDRRPLASPAPAQDEQSKKFQCKVCHLWYPTRYFLRKHMLIEHEDQLFECRVCSFNSVDPEKLKNHIIKQHITKKEKNLTHDDMQQEVEELMETKAPRKIMMEDGIVMGRDPRTKMKYSCAICERVYGSKYSLERHVRCHTGEKPYQCDVCEFSTSYIEHMQRHMINVHLIVHSDAPRPKYVPKHKRVKMEEKQVSTASIKEESSKSGSISGSESIDVSDTMSNPDDVTIAPDSPDESTVSDQSMTNSSSSASPPGKKRRDIQRLRFECAACGMRATHKADLRKHIKERHPNAHIESLVNKDGSKVHLIATSAKKVKPTQKLSITCPYCSKVWHDTWKYKMHLRSHTGVKPYGCTECMFVATTKMTVRDHIHRKHGDAPDAKITLRTVAIDGNVAEVKIDVPKKEFRCEICLEVFKCNYDFKYHSNRAHPDVLPFRCRICDLKDNLRANVTIHCLTEHKDVDIDSCVEYKGKPIKIGRVKLPTCDRCGKMFPFQSKLNLHMKLHTGERNFACDICSYKTNNKKYLENHIINRHLQEKPKRKRGRKSKNDAAEEENSSSSKRMKAEEEEEEEEEEDDEEEDEDEGEEQEGEEEEDDDEN